MSLRQRLALSDEPVFLMDGSAYIFRSFYANQNMTRSDGMPTNVLYMVLRMLLKIIREESPRHFVFVLDGRGKNFRHRMFGEYKANRSATPEPLAAQIEPLVAAIGKLGIKVAVSEDCEADDCIASLASRLAPQKPVVIVGADKDLKQCLAPGVVMWDPSSKEERVTTLASFTAEQGFGPEYWPDYQALVGDSSDNIPGVPGIGAKGANTLMREFKGLEDIFARLGAVPPALRKKLEGNRERALLSRELTRLRTGECAKLGLDELALAAPKQDELMQFMEEYQLRSLAREVASMLRINNMSAQREGAPLTSGFDSASFPTSFKVKNKDEAPAPTAPPKAGTRDGAKPGAAVPARPTLWGSEQGSLLEGFAGPAGPAADFPPLADAANLPAAPSYAVIPLRDLPGGAPKAAAAETRLVIGTGGGTDAQEFVCGRELAPGLAAALRGKNLVVPGFKQLCELWPEFRALELDRILDISLAAWLLSPEEYDYGFDKLLRRWGPEAQAWLEARARKADGPAALALGMAAVISERLTAQKLAGLLREMEMPLIPVLLDMQEAGLGMDSAAFAAFAAETQRLLDDLTAKIHAAAGQEFNIRSSQQLGKILYEDLKLPRARKTAGGQASTAQASLEKLAGKHPIIELILEYRKLEKLRSTYLEPLPRLADAAGRLHTSFNQTSTATGRLSSSSPNLQNIPVRGPLGGRMRACFTAAPGNLLVSADYSQIELRVLAHLSGDPTLLEAFRNGEDIHSRTAALIFEVSPGSVTPDQRRSAKTINFGLIYGMGPQKLAQDLGISMKEAKVFIDRYFARLGGLRVYFDSVEESAKEHGYVCTMTGRRRYIPEITSANQQMRSQARRQAINTCIQGSAADIIKLAMLAAASDAELKRLGARLILQIHDELLLECPADNAEAAGERLAALMAGVKPGGAALSVPLTTDYGSGKSWADAH